jgi:hypothetical protein
VATPLQCIGYRMCDKRPFDSSVLMSRPDLFHHSLCLSPPPSRCRPSSPLSPGYLYLCSLFVCSKFVFVKSTSVLSQFLLFPSLSFSGPPGFDPCLSCLWACLPDLSAYHWPWAWLPFCTVAHYSGLSTPDCLDLLFAFPCCCNKHCYFNTVCIWVLPETWYLLKHIHSLHC